MEELVDARGQIHRELIGPAVTMGDHRVQPVARIEGRARGSGAGVRVTPVKAIVFGPQGEVQTVPVFDLTGQMIAAIVRVGLAVAAVCGLMLLLRKLFH